LIQSTGFTRNIMDLKPVLVVLLFSSSMLAGCFGESEAANEDTSSSSVYPEPWERSDLVYDDQDIYARVSVNGTFGIDTVRSVFVPVPTITAADGGAGLTGDAEVHLGLWLPVIEGCDWESESLPEDCQVPVIAEIGPYYNDGDVDALTPADRLGKMLIENYVPHGFGVAQVSVFGTGESNHCMDLMGTDEQRGIDAAVTWLGTQGMVQWQGGHHWQVLRRFNSLASSHFWKPAPCDHRSDVRFDRCSRVDVAQRKHGSKRRYHAQRRVRVVWNRR
jgi:hypothetical protein